MKLRRISFRTLAIISTAVILLSRMAPGVLADTDLPPAEDPINYNISLGLPPGFPVKTAYLIRSFETNSQIWFSNSPDPSGIDYDPSTGQLIIVDSEVDEIIPIQTKPNVFYSTTEGTLSSTAKTYRFLTETSGVAVHPVNHHVFFSDDNVHKIFEIIPGTDGILWTADDLKLEKVVSVDAEDVAFGDNTIFVAGGTDGEILCFDLGANGVLGDDDGIPVSFEIDGYGFTDIEGITFNHETGTIFVISTASADQSWRIQSNWRVFKRLGS